MFTTIHSAIAEITLNGDLSEWNVSFLDEVPEKDLGIVHLTLSRSDLSIPPEIKISFDAPQKDAQIKWHPLRDLADSHHYLPRWWRGGKYPYCLNRNVPVFSYMNQQGVNALTFAFSDADRSVFCTSGATEENRIQTDFFLFSEITAPVKEIRFAIRIDTRKIFYSKILSDVSEWYFSMNAYQFRMPVPERARMPFYSTWYAYQKGISQKAVEEESRRLKEAGLYSVIIDDGWQCPSITGGGSDMSSCGIWNPFPGKFPALRHLVSSLHEKQISCMLWIALPFIGKKAEDLQKRFSGMFLIEKENYSVADPRCPKMRTHLADICERLVMEYDLDGLKLDFLDEMHLFGRKDPAEENAYKNCDTRNLSEGIALLLAEIRERLRAVKPEIMIEFRQFYTGPGMMRYGNIFRASDCAHDLLQNRVRTIDLRLLSGTSAVHSDMIIFSPEDSAEVAALQILNVLFSVPQISVCLNRIPEPQRKMLNFWMRFFVEHRVTLQQGTLLPLHPELSYPQVSAIGENEKITAVYSPEEVVSFSENCKWFIVNASHSEILYLEAPEGEIETFDTTGKISSGKKRFSGPFGKIRVPMSGFLIYNKS